MNSKKIIIYSLVFLIFVGLAVFILMGFFRKTTQTKLFTVKSGEGTIEIAKDLKGEKLISSTNFFVLFVFLNHWYLQNGVYKISAGSSTVDVARLIHSGKVQEYLVTIPEGWRLTQIDQELADKKIIKKGELLAVASSSEGYLFPDTYHFELGVLPEQIREIMTKDFNEKTQSLKPSSEQLIIASIVEREAKFDEDRSVIASVYFNRLKQGMKLEADPTVQYAKGSWGSITVADYKNVDSPYNTYLHEGLPPGPICNPGLKSISAAVSPASTNYLYFFNKPDGHAVFSETTAEHDEQKAKYLK